MRINDREKFQNRVKFFNSATTVRYWVPYEGMIQMYNKSMGFYLNEARILKVLIEIKLPHITNLFLN